MLAVQTFSNNCLGSLSPSLNLANELSQLQLKHYHAEASKRVLLVEEGKQRRDSIA